MRGGFKREVQADGITVPISKLCRIWAGWAGWATMALVVDYHSRELLGGHLSLIGRSQSVCPATDSSRCSRPVI